MDVFGPVPAALDHIVKCPAKERKKAAIGEDQSIFRVDHAQQHRSFVGESTQLILGPLDVRDVAQRADDPDWLSVVVDNKATGNDPAVQGTIAGAQAAFESKPVPLTLETRVQISVGR